MPVDWRVFDCLAPIIIEWRAVVVFNLFCQCEIDFLSHSLVSMLCLLCMPCDRLWSAHWKSKANLTQVERWKIIIFTQVPVAKVTVAKVRSGRFKVSWFENVTHFHPWLIQSSKSNEVGDAVVDIYFFNPQSQHNQKETFYRYIQTKVLYACGKWSNCLFVRMWVWE